MKKGRSRGDRAGPPPPPRREPGRAAAAERRAVPAGGGRREPPDATGAPGAACREAKEKDVVTEPTPLRCRKLSNPDIFSSAGKTKLHRQLSQDDCKLRRGSLASSLTGATEIGAARNACRTIHVWVQCEHSASGNEVFKCIHGLC